MRAVWLREFGGPEVLTIGEAPEPVAGTGQLVVDVEFVNITFVETQFRETGSGPFGANATLPMIPGNGVGGIVASVGTGVTPDLVGTRVITSTGGSGAYAERVAVDANAVFQVPSEVAMDSAVALLADGRTATMMVRAAAIKPGDRVLVEAAAGGVGSLIVQLAKAAGARVVAAAGGARKVAIATELGADVAVDYTDDGWPKHVRDAVGAVDVVFDGVGGAIAGTAFELLDRGGRMVSFGLASGSWSPIGEDEATTQDVTLVRPTATPAELRTYTENALAEAAAGRLRPTIGQRFPLADAAAAHAAIQSRSTVGKTLLVTR
ncbi:zinc-binding dehydrogenase [Actinophytocola oryzae]|uniref:NADPH2:quinone reductase n=1 Tax=Actinophytocola oryzae TaxID=502181 RepID=A0A4R7VVF6_9PSEU|nr:zinc-binding dehydrogenase [Actinophytocola oryzae]TDV54003.1 NADPH2:quinone reductase [Actinophytocola oryzae]